jgi:hypothetical protein
MEKFSIHIIYSQSPTQEWRDEKHIKFGCHKQQLKSNRMRYERKLLNGEVSRSIFDHVTGLGFETLTSRPEFASHVYWCHVQACTISFWRFGTLRSGSDISSLLSYLLFLFAGSSSVIAISSSCKDHVVMRFRKFVFVSISS